MDENFKLDIISPEKTLFSDDVLMVTMPAVEGDMGILKNHINFITFLKPGIINIQLKDKSSEELYIEEGTVEFSSNILTVLSSTVFKLNELSKDLVQKMIEEADKEINSNDLTDKHKFILSHKLSVLKSISI
jgi:ATP synthase F1 epsilon subunit|tara:strand:+ start:646 stop:1041 length:396 start_codon:yes stop_codon:yes gene_type:complete